MQVDVYSKKDCGICTAAKDKLTRMKIEFTEYDIEVCGSPHVGWRTDNSVDALAYHCLVQNKIPMIVIDGVPFTYSGAMRFLKERK